MKWFLVLLSLLIYVEGSCQFRFIIGSVANSGKQPLQGVSVTIRSNDSSRILAYAITGRDGHFRIGPLKESDNDLVLEFRHVGYQQEKVAINDLKDPKEFLSIMLAEKVTELKEVLIRRELPVLIRSDTVVFNANNYRDPDVKKVEDLLKKMQGFSVDASGKLSFNGKPVEKVLIDGDDLAAEGYQMITKNLNAVIIDKVEVINNFSDNRLMRKVRDSDKVGVNLKISSRFKSKLSGSAEAGLAWEGRHNVDLNTVCITQGSKWLVFGNLNNIARDVSGNAKYYFQQEGGQLSTDSRSPIGAAVLEAGSFVMPAIGDRYTRDNRDLGLAAMNSWKIGKHIRINGMIAYDHLNHHNSGSNSVQTRISEFEQWSVLSRMYMDRDSRDLVARFSFQHDPGKKQVSRVDLVVNTGKQYNSFVNTSMGDITDSLQEKLENRMAGVRFKGQHTWLIKDKVMQLDFVVDQGSLDQDLGVYSSRFLEYWQLDSSYIFNQQKLGRENGSRQLQLKVIGKTRLLQYEYGINSEHSSTLFESAGQIRSISGQPSFEPARQITAANCISAKGAFRLLFDAGKYGWFGLNGTSGIQSITTTRKNSLMVYESGLGYTKKFGLMNSFRLSYKLSRGFNRFDQLYPYQIMSGNAMILNGLKFSEPELTHGLVASINGNNIGKQRSWSATASYFNAPTRYINGADVFPQYLLQYFELTDFSRVFNLGINGEIFLHDLKSKLGSMLSFYSGKDENSVNGVKGMSARKSFKWESWWISGFRIPVNAELRFGSNYSEGNWNGGALNSFWQYYWSHKVKLRMGGSFYGSLLWNGQKISNRKAFHGLDLYATHKLNNWMHISLNGVNLCNFRRLTDVSVMAYSRSENVYLIVGRYLLASLSLTF